MNFKAQGSLEYLILISQAVLIGTIAIIMLTQSGNVLQSGIQDNISEIQDALTHGTTPEPGQPGGAQGSIPEPQGLPSPDNASGEKFSEIKERKAKLDSYIIEFLEEPVLETRSARLKEIKELKKENKASQADAIEKSLSAELASQAKKIDAEQADFAKKFSGIKPENNYKNTINAISATLSQEELELVKADPNVRAVYPNLEVRASLLDSVPLINADKVWQLNSSLQSCSGADCLTGKGVTIAIIDTGVYYPHPDLGGCLGINCKVIGGYDFVNHDNDPLDDQGHGTHVAATAAGNGTLKGVAPDAKIVAYKVLNSAGSGNFDDVIAAIERSTDPNQDGDFSDYLDIISLSLGGDCLGTYDEYCGPDDPVSQAIDRAVNAGVVAVIAAGNSGPGASTIGTPATARKAITVGAVYKKDYSQQYWSDVNPRKDQITSFSSRGPVNFLDASGEQQTMIKPDVLAPGAFICAARYDNIFPEGQHSYYYPCIDNVHVQLAGTSMATPHVSGAVALLIQKNPAFTPGEIKTILKNTAVDLGYSLNLQGSGRIDTDAAIRAEGEPLTAEITVGGKFVSGGTMEITGSAKGTDFEKYSIYSKREDCSGAAAWTKLYESPVPVENSILFDWDTSHWGEQKLELKLVVEGQNKISEAFSLLEIKNTEITEPFDLNEYAAGLDSVHQAVFNPKNQIEIKGTAAGPDFEKYEVWLCPKGYSSIGQCTKEGLSLPNNGLAPVVKGTLATLNFPAGFGTGFYNILLDNYSGGQMIRKSVIIHIDTDLHEGWPKRGFLSNIPLDQPTIADIDNDGKNDLVTAYGQTINVADDRGISLSGWPITVNNGLFFGPAVGDIDNDGFKEIVVGGYTGWVSAFRHDGTNFFPPIGSIGVTLAPVLADIDNDGFQEILLSNAGIYIHVVKKNGTEMWRKRLDPVFSGLFSPVESPAVADLDNDGYKEIVYANSSCPSSSSCAYSAMASRVWALDRLGNILSGWPKDVLQGGKISRVVLADIDNDGQKEILAGFSEGYVYAWNLDGSIVPGWQIHTETYTSYSGGYLQGPVVGDIDNDGQLEIVFTAIPPSSDSRLPSNCIFVYDNGTIANGFPVCMNYSTIRSSFDGLPVLANLDSDPQMEIFVQGKTSYRLNNLYPIYAINNDGSVVTGFPKFIDNSSPMGNTTAVGDIDNDGKNELIVSTSSRVTTFVYDTQGTSGSDEWPVFQNNARHTGCYGC